MFQNLNNRVEWPAGKAIPLPEAGATKKRLRFWSTQKSYLWLETATDRLLVTILDGDNEVILTTPPEAVLVWEGPKDTQVFMEGFTPPHRIAGSEQPALTQLHHKRDWSPEEQRQLLQAQANQLQRDKLFAQQMARMEAATQAAQAVIEANVQAEESSDVDQVTEDDTEVSEA